MNYPDPNTNGFIPALLPPVFQEREMTTDEAIQVFGREMVHQLTSTGHSFRQTKEGGSSIVRGDATVNRYVQISGGEP